MSGVLRNAGFQSGRALFFAWITPCNALSIAVFIQFTLLWCSAVPLLLAQPQN
jgi:hypothetical protein